MKGWEDDLLDHLVWLTLMHAGGGITRDEAVAELKREFPPLADEALARSRSRSRRPARAVDTTVPTAW